ncbi:hypothetical protein ACWGKW_35965 [Streptomyces sp. NPDC054766]
MTSPTQAGPLLTKWKAVVTVSPAAPLTLVPFTLKSAVLSALICHERLLSELSRSVASSAGSTP